MNVENGCKMEPQQSSTYAPYSLPCRDCSLSPVAIRLPRRDKNGSIIETSTENELLSLACRTVENELM